MDFKRIELIFLIAFLSINVFLFSTYTSGNNELNHQAETNITTDLEDRLRSEKISFKSDFSRDKREGYYLSGISDNFEKAVLAELENQTDRLDKGVLSGNFLTETSPPLTMAKFKTELDDFVKRKKNIAYGQDYVRLNVLSQDRTQQVYVQQWQNIPINDDTSKLLLTLQELESKNWIVTEYVQTHIKNIEPLREKQELITERDSIITLYMNNKIPAESKIKWTLLAYTNVFTIQGKNVYIPVWFVAIETNKNNLQIERVNAFTNAVLSTSVSEVKK